MRAIQLVVVVLCLLTACSKGPETTLSSSPATTNDTFDEHIPNALLTDDQLEEVYIEVLRENYSIVFYGVDDQEVIDSGRLTCDTLDATNGDLNLLVKTVALEFEEEIYVDAYTGLIGAAIATFCPRWEDAIQDVTT